MTTLLCDAATLTNDRNVPGRQVWHNCHVETISGHEHTDAIRPNYPDAAFSSTAHEFFVQYEVAHLPEAARLHYRHLDPYFATLTDDFRHNRTWRGNDRYLRSRRLRVRHEGP